MNYSQRMPLSARPYRVRPYRPALGSDALRAVRDADATMSHNWEPDLSDPPPGQALPTQVLDSPPYFTFYSRLP